MSKMSDQFIEDHELYVELGLGNFPFQETATFQKLDAQGKSIKYTARDIAIIVSSWYVKKDTKYYDINRLGVPLSQTDAQQSITHRAKEAFAANKLDQRTLQDLFSTVFYPQEEYDPLTAIPVWSGRTVSRPGKTQRRTFVDGLVELNLLRLKSEALNQFVESEYLARASRAKRLTTTAAS